MSPWTANPLRTRGDVLQRAVFRLVWFSLPAYALLLVVSIARGHPRILMNPLLLLAVVAIPLLGAVIDGCRLLFRRSHKMLVVVLLALVVGAGSAWLGWAWYARQMRRIHNIGLYAAALEYYRTMELPLPESVEDVVRTYNSFDHRLGRIVVNSEHALAEYRPAGSLRGGPYLVFIEASPRWYDRGTLVIYAYSDGELGRIRRVGREELRAMIDRDDRLRCQAGHKNDKNRDADKNGDAAGFGGRGRGESVRVSSRAWGGKRGQAGFRDCRRKQLCRRVPAVGIRAA